MPGEVDSFNAPVFSINCL